MPANGTSTTNKAQTPATSREASARRVREGLTKVRNGTVAYVRQTGERAVDVPVGAAIVTAERVNGLVEPWTSAEKVRKELESLRARVEREINKFERRGTAARRKALTRVRRTRNQLERELKQRRSSLESTVRENRARFEEQLKKAQSAVQERVPVGRTKAAA